MVFATALVLTACATLPDRSVLTRHGEGAVAVALEDLDLTTREGANTLRGRVFAAAQKVCGRAPGSVVTARPAERKCRSEVMDHYDQRFARRHDIVTPIVIKAMPAKGFNE